MKKDLKKDYSTVTEDHFPEKIELKIGEQKLEYLKRRWSEADGTRIGLRYGENPGQEAAMYELVSGSPGEGYAKAGMPLVSGIQDADIIQAGKRPSMNNLTDVDSALNILRHFEEPTAIIIKHNNPSGVASRATIREAYTEANLSDSIAAFGGVAVFNRKIGHATAEEISRNYLEVVCAPDYDSDAAELLKRKKNLRIIRMERINLLKDFSLTRHLDIKPLIDGGLMLQQSARMSIGKAEDFLAAKAEHAGRLHEVQRKPTQAEYEDLLFAWKVQQGVTSNSVIFVKNKATVAIGTGEQDRVGVAKIAAFKACEKYAARLSLEKHKMPYWLLNDEGKKKQIDLEVEQQKGNLINSVMASDGFFPFPDTVEVAAKYGVTAIVQPGGSIRDYESIEACNRHGMAMVFTGQRAFRH